MIKWNGVDITESGSKGIFGNQSGSKIIAAFDEIFRYQTELDQVYRSIMFRR